MRKILLVLALFPFAAQAQPADSWNEHLQIIVMWSGQSRADINMRISAPDENIIVSSNSQLFAKGKNLQIVRDEFERESHDAIARFEMAMTDGVPNGEYIVNVARAPRSDATPLTSVTLVVDRVKSTIAKRLLVVHGTVGNSERTLARFVIDRGRVVHKSVDQTNRKLSEPSRTEPSTPSNIWIAE